MDTNTHQIRPLQPQRPQPQEFGPLTPHVSRPLHGCILKTQEKKRYIAVVSMVIRAASRFCPYGCKFQNSVSLSQCESSLVEIMNREIMNMLLE
jgi:hypothetical protein